MKNRGNLFLLIMALPCVFFIIAGIVDGAWYFLPLGLCFILTGIILKIACKGVKK
jgi:uncharacterized ion transporter superfamily protein YfcC